MHLANPMSHKMRATNMPVVVAGDEMSPLNEIHRLIEQNELFLNTKKITMDVCKYPRTYYEKYVPFYSSAIGNPRQQSKSVTISVISNMKTFAIVSSLRAAEDPQNVGNQIETPGYNQRAVSRHIIGPMKPSKYIKSKALNASISDY